MARAKRHYIPGQIWHITHRCHKREFLLKFAKDRRRWLQWLFETNKRYGLPILNYAVTSNHIHLREPSIPYGAHFGAKKCDIGPENTFFWDVVPL
jgi:hypothetical protein